MQDTYTDKLRQRQDLPEHYFDSVNIENFEELPAGQVIKEGDDVDYPLSQVLDFRQRFPDEHEAAQTKFAIIDEWRKGCYDAMYAIFLLQTCGFIEVDRWLHAYAESVSAPIPSGYANPDLVAALAPARAQGGGQ